MKTYIKKTSLLIGVIILLTISTALIYISNRTRINTSSKADITATSFESCVAAGFSVSGSNPRQCATPSGEVFVEAQNITPATEIAVPPSGATEEADIYTEVGESGNIIVIEPQANEKITTPFSVRGQARVFENVLSYRLKDATGTILAEGTMQANSPDVGHFGAFDAKITHKSPQTTGGVLEVFSNSAEDGSEINKVTLPLKF